MTDHQGGRRSADRPDAGEATTDPETWDRDTPTQSRKAKRHHPTKQENIADYDRSMQWLNKKWGKSKGDLKDPISIYYEALILSRSSESNNIVAYKHIFMQNGSVKDPISIPARTHQTPHLGRKSRPTTKAVDITTVESKPPALPFDAMIHKKEILSLAATMGVPQHAAGEFVAEVAAAAARALFKADRKIIGLGNTELPAKPEETPHRPGTMSSDARAPMPAEYGTIREPRRETSLTLEHQSEPQPSSTSSKVESVFGKIPHEFRTKRHTTSKLTSDVLHDPAVVQTAREIVNANRRRKVKALDPEARETLRIARRIVRANESPQPAG